MPWRAEAEDQATGANVTYDTSTPVLVLKMGRYMYHAGGLGIIRSLGRAGIPTYAVCEDKFTPAAVSKYLRGKYVWPTNPADLSNAVAGIEAIGKHLRGRESGRRIVLIPTDDVSAILIAENAAALEPWFVFPRQNPDLPRMLANKRVLYQLCMKLGVACAKTYLPQSIEELTKLAKHTPFPVVVKRVEPWRPAASGLKATEIVPNAERLIQIYRESAAPYSDLLLQEYIPDAYGEDWIFHGYANGAAECVAGFTGVKIRSYPMHAGITTLGESVENERLRHEATALIRALSYRGIMDLDFRFDRREDRYKLLDFNPRVGAQFRLFQDEFGIDVVRALHLDLTGRRLPQPGPVRKRRFIVENFDLLASARYLRAGDITSGQWLRSLRSVDETAFFAHDDLVPFLSMTTRFLMHGAMRSLGIRRPIEAKAEPRFVPGRGTEGACRTSRKGRR